MHFTGLKDHDSIYNVYKTELSGDLRNETTPQTIKTIFDKAVQ